MSQDIVPVYVSPPEYPEASSSTQPPPHPDFANTTSLHDTKSPSDFPDSDSDSEVSSRSSSPSPPPEPIEVPKDGGNNPDFDTLDSCTLSSRLVAAVENRQDDILGLYFVNGIPVDMYTCQGNTLLFLAIRAGDLRLTRFLLNQGANPSRWSSSASDKQWHSPRDAHLRRDFFLDVAPDEKDLKPRVVKYEKKNKPKDGYSLYHFYDTIDALYSARTPLMEAASVGNLAIVKLLVEQHGVDPLLVAPDGQTAFRLARDNGHAAVAEYLPATNTGGLRRIKNRSRTTVRKLKHIGENIWYYTRIITFEIPKFFIWTLPKEALKGIYRTLTNAEKMKRFFRFVFVKVPKFFFWHLPKFFLWDLPKELPSILRDLGKWIWEAMSVHIPRFLKRLGLGVWYYTKLVGVKIGHAVQAILSAIHTAILAIISFLRSVTLKDVWNGIVVAFRALFIDLPLLLWQGLKGAWKIFDYMMCGIFNIFWLLAKCLVMDVLLFIPVQLWHGLVEVGGWLGRVGREILLFINPKW
ncbi:hypothetical protein DL96DRAFT_1820810 [Flagelloscypha sp. PMI_526]|nr:hypothetical protein DL96DRAFT_1820810 [Flagelloscypha sp. PMI_526]